MKLCEIKVLQENARWPQTKEEVEARISNIFGANDYGGNIGKYRINDDLTVDVAGNVEINNNEELEYLPVKFGKVKGNFIIGYCNNLISLEGSPSFVGKGFTISSAKLTTLNGCTKIVKGSFSCSGCSALLSLVGCPTSIGKAFYCTQCVSLSSLEGMPATVTGEFSCLGCAGLLSLNGCPSVVEGNFTCSMNRSLKSLRFGPASVNGNYDCSMNPLINSLEDFNATTIDGEFSFDSENIKYGGLALVIIGCTFYVDRDPPGPFVIIHKFIGRGEDGIIECQSELIEAGYEEYAVL